MQVLWLRCHLIRGLVLSAAIALAGVRSDAAVQSTNPVADAFVSANPARSGNNFGGAGALEVSAPGLPNGEYQGLMKFNLAAAKASFDATFGAGAWTVDAVTLQLTSSTPNNPIFNANAVGQFTISWMQNDSWVEGTGTPGAPTTDGITYSTLPSFQSGADQSLGTFTSPGTNSGSNTFSLGLPSGFVADLTAGGDMSLRVFAADSTASYLFNSRSFGTIANRPLLTVTAVPEPVLASLVTIGALLYAVRRTRSHT
jgi:hypothetical protein